MTPEPEQTGMLYVQSKPCATCIYTKRSPTPRSATELEDECRETRTPWFFKSYRVCHHAHSCLAVCAGFWQRWRDRFQWGQIAQRMGWVVYVEVDDLARPVCTPTQGRRHA